MTRTFGTPVLQHEPRLVCRPGGRYHGPPHLLPAKARVAGRDTIRISARGAEAAQVVPTHLRN